MKMEDLCPDCGARFGEHRLGGHYHPNPLTPEAERREKAWSSYAIDTQTMPKEKALEIALDCRAAAERAEIVAEIRQALGLDDDRHARHNLDGALIDIEHAVDFRADGVCRATIRRVIEQLADVEQIIERGDHAQPEPAR